METRLLVGGIAALLGFAFLYAATFLAARSLRRRAVAMASQGDPLSPGGLLAWRLRNGFKWLLAPAELLMRNARVHRLAEELCVMTSQRNMPSTPPAALSCLLALVAGIALAAGALSGSPIAAAACPLCAACLIATLASNARDKRDEEVREAVPEALESMSSCFGSGFTLLQTFRQVAADTPGALGETFSRSAHVLEMGGSAEKALAGLREGAHASQLAFVAVALDVQHQSGGAMRQVLDAATDTVKGELALRRSLRVQTAQAKLSARVVVVMPFILVAAFSLASPDFLSPFFSSVPGYALLGLAVVMQLAGVMLVRRALAVEGVA